MTNRTTGQTLLIVLGSLVLLAGLVCVAVGFAQFADTDPMSDDNGPMFLFAGGGLAAVIGFGIVVFTRVATLRANGGYRVTIESGRRQDGPPVG
ncbi:hypothetical protein [Nocardioides aquiterrae]|uniref:Uncharacterized protein n=1 Tax=Nocardioides aquiterrae TaxID=203799 RepID=A0ABP4EVQ0_9ACTN